MPGRVLKRFILTGDETMDEEKNTLEQGSCKPDVSNADVLTDYGREAELARHYEQTLREKQREELLGKSSKRHSFVVDPIAYNRNVSDGWKRDPQEITKVETHSNELTPSLQRDGKPIDVATQPLFINKQREKVLSNLTLELLEPMRVGPAKIREMEEHPRIEYYLQDCVVIVAKKAFSAEENLHSNYTYVVTRIASISMHDAVTTGCRFDLIVIPFHASTSVRVSIDHILEKELDESDIKDIRALVQTSPEVYRDLVNFKSTAKNVAKKLAEFTFTENDVEQILERKKAERSSFSMNPTVTYRQCYREAEELKIQIDHLHHQLQDPSLPSPQKQFLGKLYQEAEVKMKQLHENLNYIEIHSPPSSDLPTARSRHSQPSEASELFICGGTTYRPSYSVEGRLWKSLKHGVEGVDPEHFAPLLSLSASFRKNNSASQLCLIRSVISHHTASKMTDNLPCASMPLTTSNLLYLDVATSCLSIFHEDLILLNAMDAFQSAIRHVSLKDLHTMCKEESESRLPPYIILASGSTPILTPPPTSPCIDFDVYFERISN